MMGYPSEALYEEVAFIAYYLSLEHGDRRRWVAEVSRINQQVNQTVRQEA
jgi:hypothetical protein